MEMMRKVLSILRHNKLFGQIIYRLNYNVEYLKFSSKTLASDIFINSFVFIQTKNDDIVNIIKQWRLC